MSVSSTLVVPRLLGISGSLRQASYCTAVLHSLASLWATRAALEVRTLHDVPLYNADLDGVDAPEGVQALKSAIAAGDALVICSPEYNYSIPGVLKNALDWASRPGFASPLKGKPVLVITASPGTAGGVRAQASIKEALMGALARPVVRQHIAIANVQNRLEAGRLSDATTIALLEEALKDLLQDVAAQPSSSAPGALSRAS